MYTEISPYDGETRKEKENGFFPVSEIKTGDYIKVEVTLTECENEGVHYPIIKIRSAKKRKNNTVLLSDDVSPDNELAIKTDTYYKKYTKKFIVKCKYAFSLGYFEKKQQQEQDEE